LKITRRQLRRLIESVYVDPEGIAVDSATDTMKQFEQFDKIVDRLLSLLPPDQSSKLSLLLKSDDEMNQNMALELIEQLAMFSDNEAEIKSALLQYALKAVRENFDVLLKNAVNYASPTSPGYSQGWQVETSFDIIDMIKKYPKGASYVKIAKLLGKDRDLKNMVSDAIHEPMDDSDISSLYHQVTGILSPDWFDNFTSSNPRGFVD
jgi:hypothetical protein